MRGALGVGMALVCGLLVASCGAKAAHPAADHAKKTVRQTHSDAGGAKKPKPPAAQTTLIGKPSPVTVIGTTYANLVGTPPSAYTVTDVAMATGEVGWAAGTGLGMTAYPYLALETTDGGHSFTKLFTAPKPIFTVSTPDAQHAFYLEQYCVNGGGCSSELQEWTAGNKVPVTLWTNPNDASIAMSFPTLNDGYVAVADSMDMQPSLRVTHDGGASWSTLPLPYGEWDPIAPGAMDFTSAVTGWLLCPGTAPQASQSGGQSQAKALYTTTDGGQHWSLVSKSATQAGPGSLPEAGYIGSLYFTSAQTGYVGLSGAGVYGTRDGGKTWSRLFPKDTPDGHTSEVGFLPGGFGWMLGGSGPQLKVTADGGKQWHTVFGPPPPVPSGGIWRSSGGHLLATALVAGGSALIQSSDEGAHWTTVAALSNSWPFSFDVLPNGELVSNGRPTMTSGSVRESIDLGQHWSHVASLPITWQVSELGYLTPNQGWVIGQQRNSTLGLFQCSGGGCSRIPTPFMPQSAQMTGATSGYTIGRDTQGREELFTTKDSGAHWKEHLVPGTYAVGGTGSLRWLFSTDYSPLSFGEISMNRPITFLVSRDGGQTWRRIILPASTQSVMSLTFFDPTHAILVTQQPATGVSCWETSDGGATFYLL
ncbi:MAG: hypothetical protein M0Z66_06475 [Thermaerobacter sp.]|nr:hypothetical protein [Thermaerobacter sp.]